MRFARPLTLLALSLLLLWAPPSAGARVGCAAPPGTAATDQYCENLTTVAGAIDATAPDAAPLATVLPRPTETRLRKAGLLGDVLRAMPDPGKFARLSSHERAVANPRLDPLKPGAGADLGSVANSTAKVGGYVDQGFAWTLVISLLAIAGVSVWGSLRGWSLR